MEKSKLAGVLAGVVGAVIGTYVSRGLFSGGSSMSDQTLADAASSLNKNLPMMVDAHTELMNTGGANQVFVYNYRLVNLSAEDVDPQNLIATLKPQVQNAACTTPETRDGLLKKGVSLRYSYADKDRTHIARFDVTPADCGL